MKSQQKIEGYEGSLIGAGKAVFEFTILGYLLNGLTCTLVSVHFSSF